MCITGRFAPTGFFISKIFGLQTDIIHILDNIAYRSKDMSETLLSVLEWIAVAFNLLFIVLLVKKNILCWIFGILGSLLSVFLFLSPEVKLYSEAILYGVYALLGIYGWYMWRGRKESDFTIITWDIPFHVLSILIGLFIWIALGYVMTNYTSAQTPWADAFSTSFGFVATYLEAKKVLQGWYYWIVLNLFSIFLYASKNLDILALMMVVYSVLSVIGLIRWRKDYKAQMN